jgi:PAS domain S-box-containing protein
MRSAPRVWLTVGPIALAAGVGAVVVVLGSTHEENRILVSVLGLIVGWAFAVSGLIALTRRPENPTGVLMIVVGLAFFVGALGDSNNSILFTIGMVFGAMFIGALIHLMLAYPSGRLAARERQVVIAGYALALLANLLPTLFDPTPGGDPCDGCPENALLLWDSPLTDAIVSVILEGLAVVLLAVVVLMLARSWRGAGPAARRLLGPVLLVGVATLGFFALTLVVYPLSSAAADLISIGFVVGFVSLPFVFLWGILRSRLARSDVGALLADSAETPTLQETQDAVREALHDPTADLVYRLEDLGGYFDAERQRVQLDEIKRGRAVTEIAGEEGPVAAIVHDPALLEEPELLASVAMALRLRLEKDRSVRALRISEYRSRALLDAIPDTMFRVARDGTILDIHSHDPENVVYTPEEMIGTNLYDIPPDVVARETIEERKELVARAFETGEPQSQAYEVQMPTGGRRFAETRFVPSGDNEFVMIVRDVTQERLTESRSRALLEAMPDAMFRLSRDGRFLDYHTPHPEVLAIAADEILEKTIYDVPPERIDADVIQERMELAERAFETGRVQHQEYEIRRPDGDTMFCEARIVPAGDDEWVMIVRDVTDKRVMESRNEALLQALPDSVFRLTRDGIYLDFRARNAEHYLVETDSFVGVSIRDALPPTVAEGVMAAAERAFATGEMQTVEGEMEHEGETVYAEARIVPSGENEFVMIVRDVTERKTGQDELHRLHAELQAHADAIERQRDMLSAIGDSTTGLLCVVTNDGAIGFDGVNLPLRRLLGYAENEADGRIFWEVFSAPEDAGTVESVLRAVAAGEDVGEQESRWLTSDGKELLIAWTCTRMPALEDTPRLLISGTDVTERVSHEERIQSERDFFGALFDATPSFICVVDHDGVMTGHSLNASMILLTGYDDEDVAGKPFAEVFSAPEDAARVQAVIAAAVAGGEPAEQETTWLTRDGVRLLVAWTCTPLPEREAAHRLVISGTDVSERKLREDEQSALRRVAVAVASERRPEEIFQTVTEEVGRVLGADGASMLRFVPDGTEGVIMGWWQRADPVQDDTALGRFVTFTGGPSGLVLETGRSTRFEVDGPLEPEWRERLLAEGTSCVLTTPVLLAGRVWGAVSATLKQGTFPADAEQRVAQFTSLVSTALANAQAREELLTSLTERKQREDEQAALRRVAVAVASEQRPEHVFQTVAEEIGLLFGGDNTHLVRYQGEDEAIVVGGWANGAIDAAVIGRRVRILEGVMATVRDVGRAVRIERDSADAMAREQMGVQGLTSVLAAPVHVSGMLWGAVATGAADTVFPPDAEERIAQFTSLVATAIANAEAREEVIASRARMVEAGDAERRRLERNLHDGAQQRLVSLSLSLRLAQARLKSDADAANEILSGASAELALALEELRELARGIHPAVLTDRGLGPALESLADRTPLPIRFDELPEERLPPPIEAAAFYVVSEALANVAKYADASSVCVRVAQANGYAIVEVSDDGVGGADPQGGSGLRGLSDRVAALEGRLAIVSPPGAGTVIRAEIPFG